MYRVSRYPQRMTVFWRAGCVVPTGLVADVPVSRTGTASLDGLFVLGGPPLCALRSTSALTRQLHSLLIAHRFLADVLFLPRVSPITGVPACASYQSSPPP